ncbi:MAG: hypothetical protein VB980_05110, partial [Opitutales bacterium]
MESSSDNSALISFSIYIGFTFLLAWLAGRKKSGKEFVDEYFLGNRNLGLWAFALTFAATSSSGGSFMGFPSLIYVHGWSLALWIAGYMFVPVLGMALLGKRLNRLARKVDAITVPEVLRKRFGDQRVGEVATGLLLFFMFFYLLAQFKAGGKIMATLLDDVEVFRTTTEWMRETTAGLPWVGQADPAYLVCLGVFAVAVIAYVTYGGFRAVVWTDVMQGVVMGIGVLVMLWLALTQVGSLENATRKMAEMTPPEKGKATFQWEGFGEAPQLPKGTWLTIPTLAGEERILRLAESLHFLQDNNGSSNAEVLLLTSEPERERIEPLALPTGLSLVSLNTKPYQSGACEKGIYLRPPGPSADHAGGFLSVGLALSFFLFWPFGNSGQPSNMVRLMAFRDVNTLRRAILLVCVYYSFLYFSLVIIFCCGRLLLPGMEIDPDRIMPELATHLTAAAGVPWLAGLLVAAPFAAVMSSVDSFLLLVSSTVVRDVYQQRVNPNASEQKIKRLTYWTTCLLGVGAALAVVNPPEFLQTLIIFASGGLAGCFLMPMTLGLYWPRMTATGALAGMLGGLITYGGCYLAGWFIHGKFAAYTPLDFHPFLWSLLVSGMAVVIVSLTSIPPDQRLVSKFF